MGSSALACEAAPAARSEEVPAADEIPVLAAVWETPRDTIDNIDSPAVWHGAAGEHWLLATAKETDVIVVAEAATGEVLRRVGGEGTAPGQLDRPNGIAVMDDLMFVVERDNARVQVFSLPAFTPLGTFGAPDLVLPYGIALVRETPGAYDVFVTDNYELVEDAVPPDSLLGERVRRYRVTRSGARIEGSLQATFGDTEGPGVLRVVESIAVDPAHDRLLIAEEQEGASMLKAYTLDGRFRGEIVPASFFPHQAEGIVLYVCGEGG
jgi:3-phytase